MYFIAIHYYEALIICVGASIVLSLLYNTFKKIISIISTKDAGKRDNHPHKLLLQVSYHICNDSTFLTQWSGSLQRKVMFKSLKTNEKYVKE